MAQHTWDIWGSGAFPSLPFPSTLSDGTDRPDITAYAQWHWHFSALHLSALHITAACNIFSWGSFLSLFLSPSFPSASFFLNNSDTAQYPSINLVARVPSESPEVPRKTRYPISPSPFPPCAPSLLPSALSFPFPFPPISYPFFFLCFRCEVPPLRLADGRHIYPLASLTLHNSHILYATR